MQIGEINSHHISAAENAIVSKVTKQKRRSFSLVHKLAMAPVAVAASLLLVVSLNNHNTNHEMQMVAPAHHLERIESSEVSEIAGDQSVLSLASVTNEEYAEKIADIITELITTNEDIPINIYFEANENKELLAPSNLIVTNEASETTELQELFIFLPQNVMQLSINVESLMSMNDIQIENVRQQFDEAILQVLDTPVIQEYSITDEGVKQSISSIVVKDKIVTFIVVENNIDDNLIIDLLINNFVEILVR